MTEIHAFSFRSFHKIDNKNRLSTPSSLKLSSCSSLSEYYGLPRLYISEDTIVAFQKGAQVELNKDQSHYLGTVLRKKTAGAKLRIFQPCQGEWLVQICDSSSKKLISVECIKPLRNSQGQWISSVETTTNDTEKRQPWLFFVPIQSKSRLKFLLEKCTELGVSQFIPIGSDRGHVPTLQSLQVTTKETKTAFDGIDDNDPTDILYSTSSPKNSKKRSDKYSSILVEASEQCERMTIPLLSNQVVRSTNQQSQQKFIGNLKELLQFWSTYDDGILYVCRERNTYSLTSGIPQDKQVGFVIGPEGGWSPEEEELFNHYCKIYPHKIKGISLGDSILRAETAAILAIGLYSIQTQSQQ